jgi:hypothetical protein
VKRLGYLRNLPAYWDEVRAKDNPNDFVSFLFQMSQGKERSRLTSAAKMQEMGTWGTMMVIATNESIVDHIKAISKSTDAGRARLFEVEVSELDKPDFDLSIRVSRLASNFGHAGVIYAQHLINNVATVTRQLEQMIGKLTVMLSPKPAERFWIVGIAAIIVGSIHAKKLGLIQTDITSLSKWLMQQVNVQRESMEEDFKTAPRHAEDFVWQYCAEFRDQFIVCDHLTGRGMPKVGRVYWIPERGQLLGTHAKEDRKVRIDKSQFIKWLYKQKETPSQIIGTLLKTGTIETLSRVAVGAPNLVIERTRCLDIPLPEDKEFVEVPTTDVQD